MHSHEQEIELHTIKTLPTLMLAASLSAGMILAAQPAFARNNGGSGQHQQQQQQHNDHQDRGGMRNAIRSENRGAPGNSQRKRFAEGKKNFGQSYKKKKDKVNVTDTGRTTSTGDGFKVTHGGTPPRAPVATPSAPKGPPPGTVTVSNGKVNLYIPNSTYGLTVTKNAGGTITVSNGDPTHSVTLPGGSVTVTGGGVTSLGSGAGLQVVHRPDGFTAAATLPPSAPPKATPLPAGTVTGGPKGGFTHALGSGVVDLVTPGEFIHFKGTAPAAPDAPQK